VDIKPLDRHSPGRNRFCQSSRRERYRHNAALSTADSRRSNHSGHNINTISFSIHGGMNLKHATDSPMSVDFSLAHYFFA
jgi:hypothetical protein